MRDRLDLKRERRLKQLLEEAYDRPAEERSEYLAERCDDPSLVAEARAALETDGQFSAFFDRPARGAARLADALGPRVAAPEEVGEYRIERMIGEGGMGTVYSASQSEPIERRVAVKLIRTVLAGPLERARFDRERQAMARLSHPNIAQLYEAGTTEDGRPYFVMELVEGGAVTEYCDARSLAVEERLRIFVDICRAVEHAHRRQLLHRDLKPSNVLVLESEGRAVPKVIDFGIAKVLDEGATQMTGRGMLGTPAYISPEAIRSGDVDTRTDVYSLGILLYELLCGKRPFDDADTSAGEVLRRVQEEEPTRPSRRFTTATDDDSRDTARKRSATARELHLALKTDLDWIVLKAIAKNREERYGSAAELAADVERYLRDEPIEARPPSAVYQLRKWSRRHQGAVVAASFAVVALIGGFVARSIEAQRAREAAARANRAAEESRRAAEEVQEVSDFLITLMSEADPEVAQGDQTTVRQALDRGAARLADELGDQPNVRARLFDAIGVIYRNLSLYDAAGSAFESAIEVRRESSDTDDFGLAESLNELGWIYYRQTRLAEAEATLEEARALLEASPDASPTALAVTFHRLAAIADEHLDLDRAGNLLERSIELLEAADEPDEEAIAARLNNLAILHLRRDRYDEAEALYDRVIETRMRVLGERHPLTIKTLVNLGVLTWLKADYVRTEELFSRALGLYEEVVGPDHVETARAASNLAQAYLDLGRYDLAAPLAERALAVEEARFGPVHSAVYLTRVRYGRILQGLGQIDGAREAYDRAFATLGEFPLDGITLAIGFVGRTELELDAGRFAEAKDFAERASTAIDLMPPGQSYRLSTYRVQALAARATSPTELEAAREILERAIAEGEAGATPHHPSVAAVHGALAALHDASGDPAAAAASYQRSLEIARAYLPVAHMEASTLVEEAEAFLAATSAR